VAILVFCPLIYDILKIHFFRKKRDFSSSCFFDVCLGIRLKHKPRNMQCALHVAVYAMSGWIAMPSQNSKTCSPASADQQSRSMYNALQTAAHTCT
jgi:hypothetical protein